MILLYSTVLYAYLYLLFIFWIQSYSTVIQIYTVVRPHCSNIYCTWMFEYYCIEYDTVSSVQVSCFTLFQILYISTVLLNTVMQWCSDSPVLYRYLFIQQYYRYRYCTVHSTKLLLVQYCTVVPVLYCSTVRHWY